MNSFRLVTRGQNTENIPDPDQSPIIRVSIKSRSSEKYLGVKNKEKIRVVNNQVGIRKEYKVNVKYFELLKNETKKTLTESKSAAGKTKIFQVLGKNGLKDYWLSKSYRKMTRFYMRNYEICNFLKDLKRDSLKSR